MTRVRVLATLTVFLLAATALAASPAYHNHPADPAIDWIGGPDAFGYSFIDNEEPGGPAFEWIEISATGSEIDLSGLAVDGSVGPFPIDIPFEFYGLERTEFYVQENGAVTFGPEGLGAGVHEMPWSGYGAMIAWFWDDLHPDGGNGGSVYYEPITLDNQQALVIQFQEIDEWNVWGDTDVTAEVILFEDGTVKLQYGTIDDGMDRTYVTIGIQDDAGAVGLTYVHWGQPSAEPYEGLAIEFGMETPTGSVLGHVLDEQTGNPVPGAMVEFGPLSLTADAGGVFLIPEIAIGDYEVELRSFDHWPTIVPATVSEGANDITFQMQELAEPSEFYNFEEGPGPFTALDPFEYGEPTYQPDAPWSGSNAWGTNLDGNYMLWQDMVFPTSESWLIENDQAYVSYWHWFSYEGGYDGYWFVISDNGGMTWTQLTPSTGYSDPDGAYDRPWFTNLNGDGEEWEQVVYAIPEEFVGQEVMFGFHHYTDDQVQGPGLTFDDFAVFTGAGTAPVTLELTGTITAIPPVGGTVVYDAFLNSSLAQPATGQAWTEVLLPNGQMYGPLMVRPITVIPGTTSAIGLTQDVPAMAPAGQYLFFGRLGIHPNYVAASDNFSFTKGGVAASGVSGWDAEGWEFTANDAGEAAAVPDRFALKSIYPNPFNPTATVTVLLPEAGELTVTVVNVSGRQVAELARGTRSAGEHTLTFDGRNLASGVYFIHASMPGHGEQVRKALLVR